MRPKDYFGSRWSAPLYAGFYILTVRGSLTGSNLSSAAAVVLMASWGPATILSPLSGTALFVGRLMNLPVWTVAWRWNAHYGVGVGVVLGIALVLARHLAGW